MQAYVHSGYYNIYRPPFSLSDVGNHKSSIYCVSDRFNTALVIIPLVPAFYKDVIDIVKNSPARHIYLIAPDVGISFISDYYLAWDTINKTLRKSCKIFSKYVIENFARADFKSDIIRAENDSISINIPRSEIDVGTIDITFSKKYVKAYAPFSCDIILNDGYKKRIFVGEMNHLKAKWFIENKNSFDEIHMAYMTGNYGGMTYLKLIQEFPTLVSKVYCNQFASTDEFLYARSRGVSVGGEYKNDFIQK